MRNFNKKISEGGWGVPLVYIGGLWGSICFDGFDGNAADFFCRNLGWLGSSRFESIPHKEVSSKLYNITGLVIPVLLTNVQCNENAASVDDCISGPMGFSNCPSGNDVAIHCGPKFPEN